MKNLQRNSMTGWIAALCLLAGPFTQAQAAKKPDFSDFRGRYKGLYIVGSGSQSVAAQITLNLTGPENGSKLDVLISGILTAGNSSLPVVASFVLNNKHQVTGTAILMGLQGPATTLPARFVGSKNNYRFTLNSSPGSTVAGAPLVATMFYTLQFTKSSISITGTGAIVQGSSQPITIAISAHKSKKG